MFLSLAFFFSFWVGRFSPSFYYFIKGVISNVLKGRLEIKLDAVDLREKVSFFSSMARALAF